MRINRLSNHPPSILKHLTAAVSRRITDILHDAEVFKEASPFCNNVLRDSGFVKSVGYIESRKVKGSGPKRSRTRTITWFNPPYSKNVVTRIGQKFLRLTDRHFALGSKLRKIFNRSMVKVSYSCMPNMGASIKRHDARVCGAEHMSDDQSKRCNCQEPDRCPLNGQCPTSSIFYKAIMSAGSTSVQKTYIGSTETSFKQPFVNHLTNFKHERYANNTELLKYIWKLKREGKIFRIN